MERIDCPLCQVDDTELWHKGRDRLLGGEETFQWVRCRRCGLLYLNPRPDVDEIARYYPREYEPFTREQQRTSWYEKLRYRVAMARMCHIAAGGRNGGRLLDVGCGEGEFMAGMADRGWQVQGLDTSPVAVELALARGLDVFHGQLTALDPGHALFDLITMWDVLEHLHDPGSYLAQVGRLLKPDGRLVVTLPNPDGIDLRLFGPVWTGLDVPRHLYAFPGRVLTAMLERAGLAVESARCRYGGQRVSTWSLEWAIDDRLPGTRLGRLLKRAIYSPIWYWAWRPIYALVDAAGLGSSITYVCRPAGSGS